MPPHELQVPLKRLPKTALPCPVFGSRRFYVIPDVRVSAHVYAVSRFGLRSNGFDAQKCFSGYVVWRPKRQIAGFRLSSTGLLPLDNLPGPENT